MKRTLNIVLMITANGKNMSSYLVKFFKDFEERENIKVNISFVSWNRAFETIINLFKEGNPPDVFQLGTTWVMTMAHLKYISPIDIPHNTNPVLSPWLKNCCKYQGNIVAVPWLVDTIIM